METDHSADRDDVMAHANREPRSKRVLSSIAQGLERGADAFRPSRDTDAPPELPGRRRGEHLPDPSSTPTGPAAVVLDCGTSRRGSFTHVLWISPSAESLLGPTAADQMGEAIGSLEGVRRWEWEGADRLHVDAPDVTHEDVLDGARAAVEELAGR